jgi:T-complex protein 1 subunit theta
MDDVERALDDGINTYKAITKEQRFVPGAGATEIELASQIHSFGEKAPGMSMKQPFPT